MTARTRAVKEKHWGIKELGRPLTREEASKMTREEKLKVMVQRGLFESLYQHTRMDIRWEAFDEYLEAIDELSKTKWMSSFFKVKKRRKELEQIIEDRVLELQTALLPDRLRSIILKTGCDICPC